ncbi:MAG: hypothetical protein M3Z00_06680 [Actinomycetota bacterium]|nr:hypothetical protein [Actinomycetota bacterium]
MTTDVTSPDRAPVEPTLVKPGRRRSGWLLTLISIVLALIIGGIVIALSDQVVRSELPHIFSAPGPFFRDFMLSIRDAYQALITGALYDAGNNGSVSGIFGPLGGTLHQATPLILGGLSVALAFRTGLFNIGGEGQVIAGAFCSGYVGFTVHLPAFIHLPLAVLAGIAGGMFWGFIAGWLKARAGAHEVITTIMLNWIATYLLLWLISLSSIVDPSNSQQSKAIDNSARLPHLFGSGLLVDWGFVLAILAAWWLWWLLKRSKLGFQLRAVGANPAASRTAGINVGAMTMIAMALAGALAGLAGVTLSTGGFTSYVLTPNISSNVGFDAITVALLGRSSPWGAVGAGLLFGALKQGGAQMQATAGVQVPIDIITVIQALIVIFVAAPTLVRSIVRFKGLIGPALQTATTNLVVTVSHVRKARYPRNVVAGTLQIVVALLGLLLLATAGRSSGRAILRFSVLREKVQIPNWTYSARPMIIILCLLVVVIGALRIAKVLGPRTSAIASVLLMVWAFVSWSIAGTGNLFLVTGLLQGALFPLAIPLILGALAGVVGERAGVVNIAIEGQLLGGAFLAAVLATVSSSMWLGLAGGLLAGLVVAALLAVLAIKYFVDQVIVGVVLNLLVLGLTTFFFTKLLSPNPDGFNNPGYFPVWKVPGLSDIPVIGPILFQGTIFLYATYLLVAGVHFGLFRTRWGLRIRAVGEHPRAADTVGIKVLRTRYRAVLLGGLIAGLGGAFLVLGTGSQGSFSINMSSGQGFIALAAVILGRWRPIGAFAAALLFGFTNQLQYLLAGAGTPIDPNLLLTLPYVVTLFVVAGSGGRVRAPAADGQPYLTG